MKKMDEESDPPIDDIIVTIRHSYGDFDAPLREWIAVGPGPRCFTAPCAAKHRRTGAPLPLGSIPLRFRNNVESRRRIRDGTLEHPWPDQAEFWAACDPSCGLCRGDLRFGDHTADCELVKLGMVVKP